jgi:hypothetical protein
MHSATKTLLAALLCAPLTALIPAYQADACLPPQPGVGFYAPPVLPAMRAEQAAIPIKLYFDHGAPSIEDFDVQVSNNKGVITEGITSIVYLTSRREPNWEPGDSTRRSALLIWRPEAGIDDGEHQISVKTLTPFARDIADTISFTVNISPDAPSAQLTPPTLNATLRATPIGADLACCPIAKTSSGGYVNTCTHDEVNRPQPLQEPTGALISCGDEVGSACELCWPTRYDANPTLEASWVPAADGVPAELTYYEVTLKSASSEKTGTFYGADTFNHSFGVNSQDPSYCVSITAFGLVNSAPVTAERCFDRADLPPFPADPGAITGVDPRIQCVAPEPPTEPNQGEAEADDGGCATPGGTSPIAPAAMLAALGLVGWLRRRR